MPEPLLSVRDLCVDYVTAAGPVRAVDRVSFSLAPGEILGIAGESGSGKSTLGQALMRILPPPAVITGGEVRLGGVDVLAASERELQALRWTRISMVFQSAMDALNPVITIGEQLVDTLRAHASMSEREARARARERLALVGLPAPVLDAYAHRLSGGMRQRVGIALALVLEPSVVILDEPTTALDVIVEREVLEQIRGLQQRLGFSVLFITHDLARMLQVSDRVAVMYAARIVEVGPAAAIAGSPRHPYTQGLVRAFPSLHGDRREYEGIPGTPPALARPPAGCRFHPRCAQAIDRCLGERPELRELAPGHAVACFVAKPNGASPAGTR